MALIKLNSNSFSNWTTAIPDDSVTTAKIADDSIQSLKNRNLIINGDMRIDQRNGGASVTTPTNAYTLDRWQSGSTGSATYTVQRNAGSVTPPAGFTNYFGFSSSSAYSLAASDRVGIFQSIEGFNTAHLAFGTANAKSITLSFWVRSSLTGTFGGVCANSAYNRCYVYSYTISAANTWEYKTITIPGDTSGTWLTDNNRGIAISFAVGVGSSLLTTPGSWGGTTYFAPTGQTSVVGTNGATFYITGVQLEAGDVATPFEHESYAETLDKCERYFFKTYDTPVSTWSGDHFYDGIMRVIPSKTYVPGLTFRCRMRDTPTVTCYSKFGTSGYLTDGATDRAVSAVNGTMEHVNRVIMTSAGTDWFLIFDADAEL